MRTVYTEAGSCRKSDVLVFACCSDRSLISLCLVEGIGVVEIGPLQGVAVGGRQDG